MKKVVVLLMTLLLTAGLSACGGKPNPDTTSSSDESKVSSTPAVTATAEEIGEKLFTDITYDDDLQRVEEDTAGRIEFVAAFYGIDESLLADAALYTGSGATPEEICVMKASSEENVGAVEKAAQHRLTLQKEDFVDYAPDEMPKLDSAVIYRKGLFVVYSVSGDSTAATEIIKNLFG